MSLATRCTSCGTVFRVVQDQLKISDGWVRCGQCAEVFNAVETLFDIDREGGAAAAVPGPAIAAGAETPTAPSSAPSSAPASAPVPAPAGRPANPTKPVSLVDEGEASKRREAIEIDAPPAFSDTDVMLSADELLELEKLDGAAESLGSDARSPEPAPASPPRRAAPPSSPEPSGMALRTPVASTTTPRSLSPSPSPIVVQPPEPTEVDIDVDAKAPSFVELPRASKTGSRKPAGRSRRRVDFTDARFDSDSAESDIDDIDAEVAAALDNDPRRIRKRRPEFLRRAERAARWNSRPAKIGLAWLSTVAGVALGAQVTHHFRDDAAARWPATRPALQGWCAFAGCNVEAPRAIDEVAVESTTLTQGATPDSFKLAVMLRSRGRFALMTPSVSLTLTDLNGNLIARKVMSPADFRVAMVIAPGTEVALKATLSTPNARVTGYTVETFYP